MHVAEYMLHIAKHMHKFADALRFYDALEQAMTYKGYGAQYSQIARAITLRCTE